MSAVSFRNDWDFAARAKAPKVMKNDEVEFGMKKIAPAVQNDWDFGKRPHKGKLDVKA